MSCPSRLVHKEESMYLLSTEITVLPQDPTVPPNDEERDPRVSSSSFTINT